MRLNLKALAEIYALPCTALKSQLFVKILLNIRSPSRGWQPEHLQDEQRLGRQGLVCGLIEHALDAAAAACIVHLHCARQGRDELAHGCSCHGFGQAKDELVTGLEERRGVCKHLGLELCGLSLEWVELAGGRVRGTARESRDVSAPPLAEEWDDLWPLQLLNPRDEEQMGELFALLGKLPHVIGHYLENLVFPQAVEAKFAQIFGD